MNPRLTPAAIRKIEDRMTNDLEAHDLLELINAEFSSDPTSTQCFDRRIVERVAFCVARNKNFRL